MNIDFDLSGLALWSLVIVTVGMLVLVGTVVRMLLREQKSRWRKSKKQRVGVVAAWIIIGLVMLLLVAAWLIMGKDALQG